MIDAIIRAIENRQIESIIIVGLIVLFIWLYKEQRIQYIENRRENNENTKEVLVIYAKILNELKTFNDINLEKLEELFYQAVPYFPKETLKNFLNFRKNSNEDNYKKIKTDIEMEMFRLKSLQKNAVSYRHDSYLDSFEYFLYSSRLDIFIKPLIHTFIIAILLFLGILFFTVSTSVKLDPLVGLEIVSKTISIFLLLLTLLVFMEFIEKKIFKNTIRNVIAYIIVVVLTIGLIYLNGWYFGIASLAIYLLYIYYLIKVARDTRIQR